MPIPIFLSFYHVLPHIIMPFFNMQRSFRVCVHARVAMHAYESGRKCIHVRNMTFFEGIMLVENEHPAAKAGYGPEYHRTTSENVQRKSNVLFARVPVIVRRYNQMNNGRRDFVRLQFLTAGSCQIHPSKLFRSVQVCAATPSSRENLVPTLSWCTSILKTT